MDKDKYEVNKKYKTPDNTVTLEVGKETPNDTYMECFGVDVSKRPDAYAIEYLKCVQKRIHKKKRTNKKWAKRYGYTMKLVKGNGWKIKVEDNCFEYVQDSK